MDGMSAITEPGGESELAACPFCGSHNVGCFDAGEGFDIDWRAGCDDCAAYLIGFDNHVQATAAWNRRAPAAVEAQPDEVKRLRAVIERDRSKVAGALGRIRKVLNSYSWLAEGRGPYSYDDDRWQHEFGRASRDIHAEVEKLAPLAADWTDCPPTQAEVEEARREGGQ